MNAKWSPESSPITESSPVADNPSFRISHFAFPLSEAWRVEGFLTSPLVFLATFALFLGWMTPGIALEDSGEFATAAATLSLTHPPGYPLYLLLGRLFILVPAGSPAFRVALMSATAAAMAAVFLYAIGREVSPHPGRLGPAAGALAAVLAPALVTQATIPDKYALNMALLSGLVLLLIRAAKGNRGAAMGASLLGGLALSHHMQGLYLAPAVIGLLWRRRFRARPRTAVLAACLALAALSLKPVALPILSARSVSLMYAPLTKKAALADYLSAREYSGRFQAYTAAQKARRLFVTAPAELARQAGWPVIALGLFGALAGGRALAGFTLAGAGVVALSFALVARFQIAGVDYYVLPASAFACVLAGTGISALARAARPWAGPLLAALLAVSALARGWPRVDLSRYYGSFDRARNLLAALPDGAVLVTRHDDDFFPPMYAQRVLGERPGVVLVHRPFITRLWHLSQVERLHPGFAALDPALIPWGRTVEPDMLINMFVRSHWRRPGLAFSYPPEGEMAGGFIQVPDGPVFLAGRPGTAPPLPRQAAFARGQSRLRSRGVLASYPEGSRFREVAGAFATSWTVLAARWVDAGNPGEARACLGRADRFPYTRVREEDTNGLGEKLGSGDR